MKKKKGLTLVELIAVIAIMAIVGVVVLSLFTGTNKMLSNARTESVLQDEGRLIIEAMETDIKTGKHKDGSVNSTYDGCVIDGVNYGASTVLAGDSSSKVIYAFSKKNAVGTDEIFAYVKVGNRLLKTKVDTSTNSLITVATIGQNIDLDKTKFNATVTPGNKEVTVSFKLKNGSNDINYNIVVTQRN